MARKQRKTVQERLAIAQSNGFVPGAVLPKATERTVTAYHASRVQEVLLQWREYLAACELSKATSPTEDLCKNFLHFYIATTEGRLAEKVTKTSVVTFWKRAINALNLDLDIANEGHKYIANDLNLSIKTRVRHIVSPRDIDNLLRQLWQNDAFEYTCPRVRVQIALWLCLQAFSGQRGGTFSESSCYRGSNESLWYRDTRLYLERQDDGKELLHLSVGIRFRKGKRQSARSLNIEDIPTIVFYEHDDPARNIISYFIAPALADGALKKVRTVDDVIKTRIPPGQKVWVFDWKESIHETPVFQAVNEKGVTGKSLTFAAIRGLVVHLGHRAGYTGEITMHAIRRAFLNSVNAKYSVAQRNQVAGHSGKMFEEPYQSSVSSVDGWALMTGKPLKTNHASVLHSMALFHRYDTPNKLPTRIKDEMLKDEEYSMVIDRLTVLCKSLNDDPSNNDLVNERARCYRHTGAINGT